MSRAGFAYAHARLQLRLSEVPSDIEWQLIENSGDLAQCLDAIGRSPAADAVVALSRDSDVHDVEQALRDAWAARVQQVAGWAPERMRPALLWLRLLPHLRMLETWLAGEDVPGWLRHDRIFGPLWGSNDVPAGWEAGAVRDQAAATDAAAVWQQEFERRLPRGAISGPARFEVDHVLARALGVESAPQGVGEIGAKALRERLAILFRTHAQSVSALIAGLCLIALDFERLRGALVLRAAFASPPGDRVA